MADHSSNISIVNGYTSSKLTRMSYHALQGNWITPPRSEINSAESDAFSLGAANDVSEGDVTYRTTTGTQFKVYFKCSSTGNVCTVTPPSMARATYNPQGTPLAATINILEA